MHYLIPCIGLILSSAIIVALIHRAGLRLYAKAITVTLLVGYGLVLGDCRAGWVLVVVSGLLIVISGCLMRRHKVGPLDKPGQSPKA